MLSDVVERNQQVKLILYINTDLHARSRIKTLALRRELFEYSRF